MKAPLILPMLVLLSLPAASARASTWLIRPDGTGDFPTIQAGIDAAAPGDIVLLAAGTYTGAGNRDLDFKGKAITVTSQSGLPQSTIIDCEGLAPGFDFHNGEGPSSVLSNLTVRNGRADIWGGGIRCSGSSPTISGNTIVGCHAEADGGGISCEWASPTISHNMIKDNSAGDYGGGISCKPGSPAILYNTIVGNSADMGGGIFFSVECSPNISQNTITGNSANGGGGIAAGVATTATITNTIIAFNTSGSGLYCFLGATPTIAGCDVYGNAPGNALCGIDGGGNISADPLLCGTTGTGPFYLRSDSPCLPENNPYGNPVGAWPEGCEPPPEVPTLSGWGIGLLLAVLLGMSMWRLRQSGGL